MSILSVGNTIRGLFRVFFRGGCKNENKTKRKSIHCVDREAVRVLWCILYYTVHEKIITTTTKYISSDSQELYPHVNINPVLFQFLFLFFYG